MLMNFVLVGDERYTMPLCVTMTSILLNHRAHDIRFFLLTTGFSEESLSKINELKDIHPCEIINIPVNDYLHYFSGTNTKRSDVTYVSQATYYRLLIFKFLPSDVDKCVYIDGDMIVDANIAPIYESVTKDKLAGVVADFSSMQERELNLVKHKNMPEFKNFFANPKRYPYFNAGLFVVNIDMAKRELIFEQMINFLGRNPFPPYSDQDTLNAVMGQCYPDEMLYFPPAYNVFCDEQEKEYDERAFYDAELIERAFTNPKILHYTGVHKPWLSRLPRFYEKWWEYAKKSPYKDLKEPEYSVLEMAGRRVKIAVKTVLRKVLPDRMFMVIRKLRVFLDRNKKRG